MKDGNIFLLAVRYKIRQKINIFLFVCVSNGTINDPYYKEFINLKLVSMS